MTQQLRIGGSVTLAVAAVLQLHAQNAHAQQAPVSSEISQETVVVTGSYIRGTPEDTALPVDVVTTADLEKQGSPTLVQLIKSLPAVSGGAIGESNRFLGTSAGVATVNLRGFGAARTLVLMNGRRMATAPIGGTNGVDINLIPVAALASIEVLKDGAAATYGSDAVAGVVNFITRRDLDGFEANANYSHISNSNGDYDTSLAWGKKFGGGGNALITAGFRRRSELPTADVDWAVRRGAAGLAKDPVGGWSGASNPGVYTTGTAGQLAAGGFTTSFLDDGCTDLGGVVVSGSCRFQYTNFDNLVNDEYHYQLYGETNFDLTDNIKFHGELSFSRHEVPDERVSPAQSTVQFPTPIAASGASAGGGTSPYPAIGFNEQSRYYIPAGNPGLAAYRAAHCSGATPPAICAMLANGVVTSQTGWRPEGYGGNPLFDDAADHQSRRVDSWRASFGFNGKLAHDIGWDLAVTDMQVHSHLETPDIIVNRMQLALRGLGGPNCNPATGAPGVGSCLWFNPFSNGIAKSAVNGAANPFYAGNTTPAVINSREVLDWMHQYLVDDPTSQMSALDLVFNGELPFSLWSQPLAWAAGGQVRREHYTRQADDKSRIDLSPCVDSADDGLPGCSSRSGIYTFYGAITDYNVKRSVRAGFAELHIPVVDSLDLSAAVRYESYGGAIGATTNPKFQAKWQAFDWLAFRASTGTTFRAPNPLTTSPGSTRALAQFTSPTGTSLYRPVDTFNNPNLKPETAHTYNFGLLLKAGGFTGSVDYYRFNFKDELTTETGADLYRTMFPTTGPNKCGTALRARFTFADDNNALTDDCSPANFLGVRTNQINGPDVNTSGVDFQAQYTWTSFPGGVLALGVDGNHLIKYERGAVVTPEGITIAPAIDRAGQLELLSAFYSYPNWRGNAFANYNFGSQNLRVDFRYVGSMVDRNHALAKVDPNQQFNLTYRITVFENTTITAAVQNITDEEPSFAYSQYNYDYTSGNPLGRVYELGAKVRF